ncbi:hypothetical protein J6590_024035 [Homalodisca vitripennis]|nr:hypothetical protein J6590_024035 [Homalodisca vitripennis]
MIQFYIVSCSSAGYNTDAQDVTVLFSQDRLGMIKSTGNRRRNQSVWKIKEINSAKELLLNFYVSNGSSVGNWWCICHTDEGRPSVIPGTESGRCSRRSWGWRRLEAAETPVAAGRCRNPQVRSDSVEPAHLTAISDQAKTSPASASPLFYCHYTTSLHTYTSSADDLSCPTCPARHMTPDATTLSCIVHSTISIAMLIFSLFLHLQYFVSILTSINFPVLDAIAVTRKLLCHSENKIIIAKTYRIDRLFRALSYSTTQSSTASDEVSLRSSSQKRSAIFEGRWIRHIHQGATGGRDLLSTTSTSVSGGRASPPASVPVSAVPAHQNNRISIEDGSAEVHGSRVIHPHVSIRGLCRVLHEKTVVQRSTGHVSFILTSASGDCAAFSTRCHVKCCGQKTVVQRSTGHVSFILTSASGDCAAFSTRCHVKYCGQKTVVQRSTGHVSFILTSASGDCAAFSTRCHVKCCGQKTVVQRSTGHVSFILTSASGDCAAFSTRLDSAEVHGSRVIDPHVSTALSLRRRVQSVVSSVANLSVFNHSDMVSVPADCMPSITLVIGHNSSAYHILSHLPSVQA